MKKIKIIFVALSMALAAAVASAQNITVSGIVKDQTGVGVPGAAVSVEGTTTGTVTEIDGTYSLPAPANGTLLVQCLGYISETVAVNGRKNIDVVLKEDTQLLEETVIVGYGSGQKVGNLVGSVKTVKSETIKNAPSASALDLLQGQVAGLSVLTSGGVAGDNNVSMMLHGHGSLSSSTSPLFVIDGIPSSSRSIMSMNPNDIASVSVLKDASATSIYGSRAANGVVYVTTKAGAYNNRATISVRSQYGVSTLASTRMYDNMMDSDELIDFWIRSGIETPTSIKETYLDKGYNYNTKWQYYFQNMVNPQYQNDVTIEGGGQKVAYLIAASQFHQRGQAINNDYDRYTVRSNVQARPKDWIKLGANVNLSLDKTTSNANWGSASSMGGNNYLVGGLSMILNPLYPAIDPVTGKEYEWEYPLWAGCLNQKTMFQYRGGTTNRYGLNASTFVEIEPVRGLKITSRAGLDGSMSLRDAYTLPSLTLRYPSYTTYKRKDSTMQYQATITNTIEYSKSINPDNSFSILVGQEGYKYYYDSFYARADGQTDDRLMNIQNGTAASRTMSESYVQTQSLSFFGHADYSLFDRYVFDASFRRDASSVFGRDNRWANFWAVGGLWKVKNESFLRDASWIDNLNVKLSYGTQGNSSIDDYLPYATISSSTNYNDGSSLIVSSPSNYRLTWENQALFTAALTGRVFNMVDFEFEVYDRTTTDMLMSVPQPYSTGFTSVMSNVGGLSNRGIDITLGVDILRASDHFLRFNATFNYNREKITELFDGRQEWTIANTGITYVVGQPVSFYYPLYAGIDPEDGEMMWYVPTGYEKYKETGDISCIDANTTRRDPDAVVKSDEFDEDLLRQNTGKKRYAPINGGFGFSGGWKGLSFVADFTYVLGKSLINNDAYFYANPVQFAGNNTSRAVSDFWTPEHKDAKYPNWANGAVMQFDDHMLEDASFLRLKSLQIGYDLPKKALAWTNGVLNGVKITLTGRNLFTITNYEGADPEANSNLTLGLPGSTKQILGGIEITF